MRYLAWGRNGMVLDKDERRRQVKLDLDGVALWVKEADLGPAEVRAAKAAPMPVAAAGSEVPALVLDLRGKRADEALGELERFLDTSLLRGAGSWRSSTVGHGCLRREVHEFLRHSPVVDAFALAPEDRGGDGMTEVTLK